MIEEINFSIKKKISCFQTNANSVIVCIMRLLFTVEVDRAPLYQAPKKDPEPEKKEDPTPKPPPKRKRATPGGDTVPKSRTGSAASIKVSLIISYYVGMPCLSAAISSENINTTYYHTPCRFFC